MPRGHQGTTQRRARISSPPRSRRAAAHCTARQEDRRRPKTRAPPTSANHTHAHATIKQQATLAITPPQRAASTTSSREASARAPTGAAARGAAFLIATRSTITRELRDRRRATRVCRAKRTDHRERAERRCDECSKNALACVRPPNHPIPLATAAPRRVSHHHESDRRSHRSETTGSDAQVRVCAIPNEPRTGASGRGVATSEWRETALACACDPHK